MKDRYIFPAIFDYADDGISVKFPDLPGAFSCGETDEEAFRMAKECLALHLYGWNKTEKRFRNQPVRLTLDSMLTSPPFSSTYGCRHSVTIWRRRL
ncbi:type II toxin-antitoxin system HicB family antitoxin [Paenibacillus melissococcoides]|uniref:Type II toxin-antitoxin system HicB family antitoxin n=1 Tax=Paenibacillus melissococcoides TaxID=2912268 RepID=A0ABN8U5M5_9BACL|nr:MULTISPECIES: type II toxin-antitoxin system HicB family antitoxin [Paenibacillus]MEB9896011.1 type II toxin-antitoxin system HicB family antitoxin [Bacillus cereus]CAH8245564.1 type II toxin-antitoxin system HicB family antitoxin [Paenibacillus melissococcoides]CAH8711321.1 type II toxin-antitoxin system HicB family antitoxin [Paenibacillus melissococcoides]CAH8712086.1 type II toxin-antitoxin system HicB family antitoxin [Paenibacillus melissococcoides]